MIPPVLYLNKEDCCACGACLNICPKQAISMEEDELGFLYPQINKSLCIGCGACKRVCAFQNTDVENEPIKCFAAISRNAEQSKCSASGGVFAALATKIIKEGGIVFGAAFDEGWNLRHTSVDCIDQLKVLQGSKYVQSNTLNTFSEVEDELNKGRMVLYSGTPCQIAGLFGYLGRDYNNLLTIDIVCHGVPNNRMLKEYIYLLEKKFRGKLSAFTFRDKAIGWGINGSAVINGKKIKLWQSASSYIYYFTKASIYRENCYKCKYAGKHRPADLTIGDFWGIEKQHPEYLDKNNWNFPVGISLLIGNTIKGIQYINDISDYIDLKESTFHSVSVGNAQLQQPCKRDTRDEIVQFYKEYGFEALDNRFKKKIGIRKYSSILKAFLPNKVKILLKQFI
ncbi:MAG: 4Fe-4S dicluster domain-containing protein [Butyrivibrio sp.]|nr:4Fe-4S dicluster domain-containing protein [Butyrivibrio sp.]